VPAIAEPFVTVLIDVNWSSGRLLREYTVLLDPPFYEETVVQTSPVAAAVAEFVTDSSADGVVTRPVEAPASELLVDLTPVVETAAVEPAPETAAVVPAQPLPLTPADPVPAPALLPTASADSNFISAEPELLGADPASVSAGLATGDYQVKSGDTLWQLADDARGGSGLSINQMMLALYRANPQAFIGNINGLKAGVILRIPEWEQIAEIDRGTATAEVREQNNVWQGASNEFSTSATNDAPRLELVAPGTDASLLAGDAADSGASANNAQVAAETADLKARVAELESQLGDNDRLLEVRDAELSALQARLQGMEAQTEASADVSELASEAGALDSELAAEVSELELESGVIDAGLEVALDAELEAALESEIESELLDQQEAEFEGSAATDASEPSLVDRLLSNIWLGVGIVIALIVVVLLARRRKVSIEDAPIDAGEWNDQPPRETALDDAEPGGDVREDPRLDDAIVFDERDPMAPAEFEAVNGRPSSPDTAADDAVSEAAPVAELAAATDVGDDIEVPLETTISTGAPVNMGQSGPIAEAEFHMAYGLYDQAADLLTQALATEPNNRAYRIKLVEVYFVWENREGFLGQAKILHESLDDDSQNDWSKVLILGKQLCPDDALFFGADTSASSSASMDFELPEGTLSETSVDFSLDSPTVEIGAMSGAPADADIDFDLSEVDFLVDEASVDVNLDMVDEGSESSDGAADNDLAMNFGDAHETDMPNSSLTFDLSEMEGSDRGEETVESSTLESMGSKGDTSEMLAIDTIGSDADDLDFGDLDLSTDEISDDEVSLDDGALMISDPIAQPGIFDEPQLHDTEERVPDGLDNDSDLSVDPGVDDTVEQPGVAAGTTETDSDVTVEVLQDVTMTVVGTKLDLARAYVDMGDPDGARSILNEVIVEGSEAQRQEARQLLGELGD
jgi:pilus assembly protein FimV